MKGKTVVLAGGTSGIGEITAERLAQMGARIVLIARDKSRGKATLARLHVRTPGLGHAVHYADLVRIPEMKRMAAEIALRAKPHGLFRRHRRAARTAPRLGAGTHRQRFFSRPSGGHIGFRRSAVGKGLRSHESLWSLQVLRANLPAAAWHEGHRQFVHPGFVATRFGDRSGGVISRFVGLAKLFAISPEKSAETIIYLASSAAVTETTGVYFYQRPPIIGYFLAITSLRASAA
jgi:hypothetical protein